ncbi:MAG: efflux RND transporter periplasmic adaptor subunit [Planctomycetota bacterium]
MRMSKARVAWGLLIALAGAIALFLATGWLRFGAGSRVVGWQDQDQQAGREAGETGGKGHIVGTSVIMDSTTAQSLNIETAPAAPGSIASLLRVAGEVRLAEDRTAHVTPRIPGTIREVNKNIGDAVTAGEVVCTIESTELGQAKAACTLACAEAAIAGRNAELWRQLRGQEAKTEPAPFAPSGWVDLDQAWADHLSAVSESGLAERLYARWKELNEKGLKTTTELWTAESEALKARLHVESAERRLAVLGVVADNALARARVQLDAAKGGLRAMGLNEAEIAEVAACAGGSTLDGRYAVRSPIAGFVLDRHATLGESVGPEDHAFLVGDLSEVWVQASVHDRDIASVMEGMAARVSVLGAGGEGFPGVVGLVGRIVDERTRTLLIRVQVKNPPDDLARGRIPLRPGMFATVDLEIARHDGDIIVPVSAVMTIDGASVVFVRSRAPAAGAGGDTAYEKRLVVAGLRDERNVEVVKGLAVGDEVVTTNAYLLKSEFERSRLEAE